MEKVLKRFRLILAVLFLTVTVSGACAAFSAETVQAAAKKNGFVTEKGVTYYYKNGTKLKGFQKINGKTYYFWSNGSQKQGWLKIKGKSYYFTYSSDPVKRVMAVGWKKDKQGVRRYFNKNGVMATGWTTIGSDKYFFGTNGAMKTGWKTEGKKRYYFTSEGKLVRNKLFYDGKRKQYRYFDANGRMVRKWFTTSNGFKRYFTTNYNDISKDGIMLFGFQKIDGATYYFLSKTGYRATGWITRKSDNARFYFDPNKSGRMVVNTTRKIGNTTYVFDKNGVATAQVKSDSAVTAGAGSNKTVKNYLLNALQPVGQALYIWGGGWTQSTVKGVPQTWKDWYNSQNSSYNYNNYRDLTTANRIKGLDCSGFVGWTCYQIMQTKSGVGYGYTVVSGDVGDSYRARGWGSIMTQSSLRSTNYKMMPGDIGYDSGHTWIVIGQCKDKSCVIVHSTPQAGVQISGTPIPGGSYSSQAVALAKKYMSRYKGYTKYTYNTSSGNYVQRGNYFRWNAATLADPEGYRNKTADQILADLFK